LFNRSDARRTDTIYSLIGARQCGSSRSRGFSKVPRVIAPRCAVSNFIPSRIIQPGWQTWSADDVRSMRHSLCERKNTNFCGPSSTSRRDEPAAKRHFVEQCNGNAW